MKTSPYSVDLKQKVIDYLNIGGNQASASTLFNIHRNTISRWVKRYKTEKTLHPKKRPGAKRKLDPEQLKLFIEKNTNFQLKDIGNHFNITVACASIVLKKMGYTYKKKHIPTWKRMKQKEDST